MSIKSFALIAATIAATATGASANNAFTFQGDLDSASALDLGLIRAEGAGVVEVYDFHRGELGQLLGTEMVNAGANTNVRVPLDLATKNDVIALLKVDGEVVAEQEFDINE